MCPALLINCYTLLINYITLLINRPTNHPSFSSDQLSYAQLSYSLVLSYWSSVLLFLSTVLLFWSSVLLFSSSVLLINCELSLSSDLLAYRFTHTDIISCLCSLIYFSEKYIDTGKSIHRQNIRHETSGETKRPVTKRPWWKKVHGDKTTVITKRSGIKRPYGR